MIDRRHLDQFVVAGTLVADDAVDIDDVAAMHPDKMTAVQPRFDVADGERAEQLVVAVEDGGVMRVGMHRDDLLDGQEMRAAIALDRQMAGKAPGRRTGATERRITAAAEFDALAGRGGSGNRYGGVATSATACATAVPSATAIDCGSARAGSGKRSKRNIPETQNPTTATTIARRSVESAGAPDAVVTKG